MELADETPEFEVFFKRKSYVVVLEDILDKLHHEEHLLILLFLLGAVEVVDRDPVAQLECKAQHGVIH